MYLRSTIHKSIAVLVLTLLSAIFGYLFRIILARNLTVTEYGLFYTMFAFVALFTTVVDLGLMQSVAKTIVELRLKHQFSKIKGVILSTATYQIAVSVIFSGVFIALLPYFYENYFGIADTTPFLLMLVWFITIPLDMTFKGCFLGFQKVTIHSAIDPIKIISSVILTYAFFLTGFGLLSPFIAYALINIIMFIMFLPSFLKLFPNFISTKVELTKPLFKEVFLYGVFLASASLCWAIITYTDSVMITFFRNTTETGLYQVALPLSNTLLYVVGSLNIVAYPLFTHLAAKKESTKILQGIELLYNYLFIGLIPIALVLFAFPELIITLLFGVKFLDAAQAMRVLVFGALMFSLASFNTNLLASTGKAKLVAIFSAFTAVLNVILNITLIPLYGFMGASIATTISFLFLAIISLFAIKRHHLVQLPVIKWALNFGIGLVLILFISWAKSAIKINPWLELAVIGILSAGIYMVLLVIFKVFSISAFKELLKTTISSTLKSNIPQE